MVMVDFTVDLGVGVGVRVFVTVIGPAVIVGTTVAV